MDSAHWEETYFQTLTLIASGEVTSQDSLCKLSGFPRATARQMLSDALDSDEIESLGKRKPYQLTEAGTAWLETYRAQRAVQRAALEK
jgi:DNA-binding IclR family transcriptional regulator